MMLIEQDDVIRIGLQSHTAFQIEWEVGSPAAVAADYEDVLAEGPFLLAVNDECAWAGQHAEALYRVAEKRLDPASEKAWRGLVNLYAREMGVSRQGYLLRLKSVRRRLREDKRRDWIRWERAYHWDDGIDLAWSALIDRHHPEIEAREKFGTREVRYMS